MRAVISRTKVPRAPPPQAFHTTRESRKGKASHGKAFHQHLLTLLSITQVPAKVFRITAGSYWIEQKGVVDAIEDRSNETVLFSDDIPSYILELLFSKASPNEKYELKRYFQTSVKGLLAVTLTIVLFFAPTRVNLYNHTTTAGEHLSDQDYPLSHRRDSSLAKLKSVQCLKHSSINKEIACAKP